MVAASLPTSETLELQRVHERYASRVYGIFWARVVFHWAALGFIAVLYLSENNPYQIPFQMLSLWIVASLLWAIVANTLSYHQVYGRWILFSSLVVDISWLFYFVYLTQGIKSELMIAQPMYTLMFTLVFPGSIAVVPPLSMLPLLTIVANVPLGEMAFILFTYGICNGIVVFITAYTIGCEEMQNLKILRLENQLKSLAVIEERNRLAREIHDGVGSALVSLSMQAQMLSENDDIKDSADEALEEMRNAVSFMRNDFDLFERIKSKSQSYQQKTGTKVDVLLAGDVNMLSDKQQLTLYRIFQECLTNAAKHAQATELAVNLVCSAEEITLIVKDNGIGFDTKICPPNHYGLKNITERAKSIGAQATIDSTPGKGTVISVVKRRQ